MTNLKEHIDEINTDFTNVMYAKYLQGAWGITAGYNTIPFATAILRKEIADWQVRFDCSGALCALSTSGTTAVETYPTWGNSPFPQIYQPWMCTDVSLGGSGGPFVPETVVISVSPFTVMQYEVGITGGPVVGTVSFTPLNNAGVAYLIGATTIEVALGTVLHLGTDYTFNTGTGTITLQLGRIFNLGEVYTITSFTNP